MKKPIYIDTGTKRLQVHDHNGWKNVSPAGLAASSTASSGSSNHATLSNLEWTVSGHEGTSGSQVPYFDGANDPKLVRYDNGDAMNLIGVLEDRGDLLGCTGAGSHVAFSTGSHGQILTVDSGSLTGVAWKTVSGVGATDHTSLLNLNWTQSAHTGTANSAAIFDVTGAAALLSLPVPIAYGGTGQTTQTSAFDALAPTTDKGDIVSHNGSDNIRVASGTHGQVLTVDSGSTAGVAWKTLTTNDHSLLSNLNWLASAHTGTANRVAVFNAAGQADYGRLGVDIQAYDADLEAVANLGTTGFAVRTASNTWATRTFQVTGSGVHIENASGVGGNPTFAISASLIVSSAYAPPPRPRFTNLSIEWMAQGTTVGTDTLLANTIRYTYHYEEAMSQEYDAIVSRNAAGAAGAFGKWALYSMGVNDLPGDLLWYSADVSLPGAQTNTNFFASGTWTASGSAYKNSTTNNLHLMRGQSVVKAMMRNASGSINFSSCAPARTLGQDSAALNTAGYSAFSESRTFGSGFPDTCTTGSLTHEKSGAALIMALRVA